MKLQTESKIVSQAYQLAFAAHQGQVDKGGHPYMNHPVAVAESVDTEEEQAVALLHDVVEDTPISLQNLHEQGFPDRIVNAVDCLTKRDGEPLKSYLERVKQDPLAVKVKIADLNHNSDLRRIAEPTERDYARAERYRREIAFLQSHVKYEDIFETE